jgi:hypothetical protein
MTRMIAGMTMSLDGFVADRSGSASRLYTTWPRSEAGREPHLHVRDGRDRAGGRQATDSAGDRSVQVVGGVT